MRASDSSFARRVLFILAVGLPAVTGCLPEVTQETSLRDPRAVTVLDAKRQVVLPAGREAAETEALAEDTRIAVRRDETGALWVGSGDPIVDAHGRLVVRRDANRLPILDAPVFRDGALYLSYIHSGEQQSGTRLLFATPASNVLRVRERREPRFDGFVFGLSLVFAAVGSVLLVDGATQTERSSDDRTLEMGFGVVCLAPGLTGVILQTATVLTPRSDRVLFDAQTPKNSLSPN